MTFVFGFCSVICGVGFVSVLGRTWVLVRFVLVGFVFFPNVHQWLFIEMGESFCGSWWLRMPQG